MTPTTPTTRILLHVEDDVSDATLVADLLFHASKDNYHIVRVGKFAEALERIRQDPVDVIVLDLRLPDSTGIETLRLVRKAVESTPIVVLTGSDDEQIALDCLEEGAQDYLSKSELRGSNLRRAVGCAIARVKDAQLKELRMALERYRALSSATQTTSVTAALAGSGALRLRNHAAFEELVVRYDALARSFDSLGVEALEALRLAKDNVVTAIGDLNGGPRDLLDVHLAALEKAIRQRNGDTSSSFLMEARLLALEMMGLLVDYYRVGHRRRSLAGVQT